LSPTELEDKVLFVVKRNSPALEGNPNQFYKITEANRVVGLLPGKTLGSAVLIQGKSVDVTKVMFCCRDWLDKYFLEPLKRQKWRLEDEDEVEEEQEEDLDLDFGRLELSNRYNSTTNERQLVPRNSYSQPATQTRFNQV
jgi:hypothetical protein